MEKQNSLRKSKVVIFDSIGKKRIEKQVLFYFYLNYECTVIIEKLFYVNCLVWGCCLVSLYAMCGM